jgi:hypothetical protein
LDFNRGKAIEVVGFSDLRGFVEEKLEIKNFGKKKRYIQLQ